MRLVACYITENDADLLELSLKSIIQEVDHVYIVYSPQEGDQTLKLLNIFPTGKITLVVKPYPHDDLGANGKQRNAYLELLEKNELHECMVLVLDSDEVIDDIAKLKEWIGTHDCTLKFFNVHMRHLVGDFRHEDVTVLRHYAPHRFFHYTLGDQLFYPEVEHPILQDRSVARFKENVDVITIWHLAYAKHSLDLFRKFKNHMKKSNIHTSNYLKKWYLSHMFGFYPRAEFDVTELPSFLKEHFKLQEIDDLLYFKNRQLESKHFIDASHWKDHFRPQSVLMIGDGLGHRSYALQTYGVNVEAIELSYWAVENSPYPSLLGRFKQGNIITYHTEKKYDLIVAYDILEHLEESDLNAALKNLFDACGKFALFSIPFFGDPNLELDSTHKIKRSREWWISEIERTGFTVKEAPAHFLYRHQLFVGVKK